MDFSSPSRYGVKLGAQEMATDDDVTADAVLKLHTLVFEHMATHAMAANSSDRRERKDAEKASRTEFDELLDTIKPLGPSETEARTWVLEAYEQASAANPPVTGVESLQLVAQAAWTSICQDLHGKDHIDLDRAFDVIDQRHPKG